jgi:hypothetical protein
LARELAPGPPFGWLAAESNHLENVFRRQVVIGIGGRHGPIRLMF